VLIFQINELKVLHSSMDPDVPFLVSVSGTGRLRLSGSYTNMNLRSPQAIRLTNDSHISLPLMDETELNEAGKFIRFVDSFENYNAEDQNDQSEKIDKDVQEEQLREQISS